MDPAVAAGIDEIVASVPGLRRLDPLESVPYRTIDKATFRGELEALYDEEYPADFVAAESAALTRLGLLSEGDDVRSLTLDLMGDQALAYYDPDTRMVTFVGDLTEIGPVESAVVVHEYGHALQDQHWDLEGSRTKDLTRSDRILAEVALTEGDATLLMNEWVADWAADRELGLEELDRAFGRAFSRADRKLLARMPPILRRGLVEFPYFDGYAFVNAIRARGERWDSVDEAWDARPVSSEQILHPARYPSDIPIEISLPDVAGMLGEGWERSYEQTLGEMQIGVWVADGTESGQVFGLPLRLPRAAAAEGWGGDRLASLDGPDGSWAIVWQTAWDSQRDADEFRDAARAAMKDLAGGHAVLGRDISGGSAPSVLVLVASDDPTLDLLRARLGVA